MHLHLMQNNLRKRLWRRANIRLLPSAALAIFGILINSSNGHVRHGDINHKIIALLGVFLFIVFGTAFLRVLTKTLCQLASFRHLTIGRAAAMQFMLRIVGYISLLLITLELLGVPIGKLLLGGAAIGIILGVAAQQALGNFFASIVLIISHPFTVGDTVTINSGSLGGKYIGVIKDIGLTHTKLKQDTGLVVLLPNSTILSGATIMVGNVEK